MSEFRTDFALKNFAWFLVFVLLCVLCISNILLPRIEAYKKQAIETKKTTIALKQINKDYRDIQAQLQNLVAHNASILNALYSKSDEAKLLALLQDRFSHIEIKLLSATKEQDILETHYEVVGYAPNTQSIGDFILWANTMPYISRVELPLKLEQDEKSKMIYFTAIIALKKSIYKEHEIILENNLRFDRFIP